MDFERQHEPSVEDTLISMEEYGQKSPEEKGDLRGFLLSVLQRDNRRREGVKLTEEQIEKRADRMEAVLFGLEKELTLDEIAEEIAKKENTKPISRENIRQIYVQFRRIIERNRSDVELPSGTFKFKKLLERLDDLGGANDN